MSHLFTCPRCGTFTVPWGDHIGKALMDAHQKTDCPGPQDTDRDDRIQTLHAAAARIRAVIAAYPPDAYYIPISPAVAATLAELLDGIADHTTNHLDVPGPPDDGPVIRLARLIMRNADMEILP